MLETVLKDIALIYSPRWPYSNGISNGNNAPTTILAVAILIKNRYVGYLNLFVETVDLTRLQMN